MLKKLNAAMDYIEAHLEEDFRLEEVAAGVGISDLSFRQLFYALTGMTPVSYTHLPGRIQRFNSARFLMRSGAFCSFF